MYTHVWLGRWGRRRLAGWDCESYKGDGGVSLGNRLRTRIVMCMDVASGGNLVYLLLWAYTGPPFDSRQTHSLRPNPLLCNRSSLHPTSEVYQGRVPGSWKPSISSRDFSPLQGRMGSDHLWPDITEIWPQRVAIMTIVNPDLVRKNTPRQSSWVGVNSVGFYRGVYRESPVLVGVNFWSRPLLFRELLSFMLTEWIIVSHTVSHLRGLYKLLTQLIRCKRVLESP